MTYPTTCVTCFYYWTTFSLVTGYIGISCNFKVLTHALYLSIEFLLILCDCIVDWKNCCFILVARVMLFLNIAKHCLDLSNPSLKLRRNKKLFLQAHSSSLEANESEHIPSHLLQRMKNAYMRCLCISTWT